MLSLFGFGRLIYVSILLLNAVAILSEDRFLARIGWASAHKQSAEASFGGGSRQDDSLQTKLIDLINSIRKVTRIPLIAANTLLMTYEFFLG